jgi:hypothetical protein
MPLKVTGNERFSARLAEVGDEAASSLKCARSIV